MLDTLTSPAYWRYVLFSRTGLQTALAIFGAFWLFIETLDFFSVYTRDQYGSYAFLLVVAISVVLAVVFRRPIRSISLSFPDSDVSLEVRIGNIFDAAGAIMVSSNTAFECDVAGGKIAPESLQGQFTAKYYTGDQSALLRIVQDELSGREGPPYPMGATIPVTTHGKTFYFVAMSELNEEGTASTTIESVKLALKDFGSTFANLANYRS